MTVSAIRGPAITSNFEGLALADARSHALARETSNADFTLSRCAERRFAGRASERVHLLDVLQPSRGNQALSPFASLRDHDVSVAKDLISRASKL